MGGFAAGFTSGYGLVNDMEERKRRQAADDANAAALQQRYALAVQEAKADEEYRKYMRGQAERDAAAAEAAAEATRMKAIFDMRQAGFENLLAADQEARLKKQSQASIAASEASAAASTATTEATNFKLERDRVAARLDDARLGFTQWLPMLDPNGQGVTRSVREGLKATEGSALHPTAMLGEHMAARVDSAMGFVRGEKPIQANSAELLDALNLGMDANLKAIVGSVGRNGVIKNADVISYEVVGQEEDGSPVLRLNLKVDAEGGSYEAPITVGRSNDPNAPAADIRLDDIINPVIGLSLVQAAIQEDPSMKKGILQQVRLTDPERFKAAEKRGEEEYGKYMAARSGVDDQSLLDPELPMSYFVDNALADAFASMVPSNLLYREKSVNEMRIELMQEARSKIGERGQEEVDAYIETVRNFAPGQVKNAYAKYEEQLRSGGAR